MSANPATSIAVKPKRYHPALVVLHWLIALVMFSAVLLRPEEEGRSRPEGGEGFQPSSIAQPGNFPPPGNFTPRTPTVDIHMILGVVLLVLMVLRVIVRWVTEHPDWATTGNPLLDKVGGLTHFGLYLLTFAILGAGGFMAYRDGLIAKVLGTTAVTASQSFGGFIFRALHGLSWNLLFLLLILHIGAALYHQFIVKDNLLARMWFGKKNE